MESKSNTQKVVKGVSSQTVVTIVLGALEILSFSIMSRLLTKEDFGYYAVISAIVTIFSCFSDAGFGSAIIQRKDITKKYVDTAFTLSMIFGTVTSLTLFVSASILAEMIADIKMTVPIQIMSMTLLFNCLTSLNFSIMYRRLQFLKVGIINLLSLVITTLIAVFLALKGYGYYAIIAKAVLASTITLILSYFYARTKFHFAYDKEFVRQIFGFSGWLMASGLFRNLAHDIDKLLMSRLLSVSLLGAYNRPKDFINQISTKLNGIFDTALFPVLSSIQDDKIKIISALKKSIYYMNIFAMLLTLSFAFNSELIIRVFFGEKWLDLKIVTSTLSFLMLFNIDGRLADCFLRSLGMTKQQFYFRILEALVTAVSVIIGSYWGLLGVSIAVVISNLFLKLMKIIYVANKVSVNSITIMKEILRAWQFTIFLVPATILVYIVMPNNIFGNVMLLLLFSLMCIVIFLIFPSAVGKQYKNVVYVRIKSKISGYI